MLLLQRDLEGKLVASEGRRGKLPALGHGGEGIVDTCRDHRGGSEEDEGVHPEILLRQGNGGVPARE